MKVVISILVAAVVVIFLSMAFGDPQGPGWLHLLGLGLSVAVLLVIWLSPGIDQPRGPPP